MKADDRPKFLTDEQIPAHLGHHLSRMGYDVLTVRQTNDSKYGDGDSDDEVIQLAVETGRVLITNNRADFEAIHKRLDKKHAGIIICPVEDDADLKKQAKLIEGAVEEFGTLAGTLLHIPTVRASRTEARERRRRSARG